MSRTLNSQVQRIEFNDYWADREAHGALCQGKQVICVIYNPNSLLSSLSTSLIMCATNAMQRGLNTV